MDSLNAAPMFGPSFARSLEAGAERIHGTVAGVDGARLHVDGLGGLARLGDWIELDVPTGRVTAEVIAIDRDRATAYAHQSLAGVASGVRAILKAPAPCRPSDAWLGCVIDPLARTADGAAAIEGPKARALGASPPVAARRKRVGARLSTGLSALDAFLPLCSGQRIGLFAGSGVGKSMLLGELARNVEADVVVVALIGERGREVNAFVEDALGRDGLRRAVVVASTSDQPALLKKRGAQLAMATAEHFRDAGRQVLLLFDSITRYADAHREIALAAGEPPSLHAYPPTTFRAIAELAERAGPGETGAGDITAVFSVLVAGSDMDEPVADMVRGVLDGHIVLDRTIAERGRYPAIDVRRSVSRSLPAAASASENSLIAEGRALLGVYEDAEMIVRAGLYTPGADAKIDAALRIWPELDRFLAAKESGGPEASFRRLEAILRGA